MSNVLKWTGILFIAVGIIYSITQVSDLNELRESAAYWKEAAEENYDNHLIEAEYISNYNLYTTKLTLTLVPLISCVVSGIFFLALSTIINLLQKLVNNTTRPLIQQDNIES